MVSIGLILLGGATRTRGNDRREGGSRRDRSNSVRIPRATALNRIAYPVLPREHWGTKVGMLMRPSLLNPFFALITTLPGVGSQLEKLYRRLFGREEEARVVDLLFHLPTGAIDRRARPKLRDVVPDTVVTVAVTVDRHRPPPPHRPRAPYQIYTSDETGDLILTFFNARKDYLQKLLPVGERRYVSGTIGLYDHMLQMVHPDRVVAETDSGEASSGRAGIRAYRGAQPQSGAQSRRRRARTCPDIARVAGPELGCA